MKIHDTGFTMVVTPDHGEYDIVIMRSYGQHGKVRLAIYESGVDATIKQIAPVEDYLPGTVRSSVYNMLTDYLGEHDREIVSKLATR